MKMSGGEKPSIGLNLRVTGHCNQGDRKYMEDVFSVAYQQTPDEIGMLFFCIISIIIIYYLILIYALFWTLS